MWSPLSGLRTSYLVRLIVNSYPAHLVNKNTRFLQAPFIGKEISKVKAYAITRQITLEFLYVIRTLLNSTSFQVDFLRKKDYLAFFDLNNQASLPNKVEYTSIFKGNGFLLYSNEAKLDFFLSLLEKLSTNARVQFLLVSYRGLFIDLKRASFLTKIRGVSDYFHFFITYLNQMLLFVCDSLNQVLALVLMSFYDLLFFFLKFFFFLNSFMKPL